MEDLESGNRRKGSVRSSSIPLESKILDIFYGLLPIESLKDIPNILTFVIVILSYGIIFAAFLFSVIYGYQILRDEQFLSLSKDAGSCSSISKVVNSQFMADIHGNWEGESNFEYRYAIYSGTLNNFNGNDLKFNELLRTTFDVVEEIGNYSYSLDLAENLVIWMAASIRMVSDNQVHTLQFTGDPKIVFNSQWVSSVLSNEAGICDVAPTVLYDRSVGVFTISYPIDKFLASSKCMSIVNPYHFGYIGIGPDFTFRIDMQSAITAIGVNTGIIKFSDLELVPHTDSTFVSAGILYEANYYFYPRYPGMTPLQCVNSSSDQILCAISYGTVYAYPIFNHLGASFSSPIYCDCESGIGHSSYCHYFNLLPGLLFYDYDTEDSTGYEDLVSLITSTSGRSLNRKSYNASADSVFRNQSSPEWRNEAFKFCTEGKTRGCSLITIATSNPPLATVSPYYYQVNYGSCNNSFSISKEAQAKLLATPPTPLSEIYYECTRSKYDSFVSALGVSVGNAVVVRNFIIIFLAFVFILCNRTDPIFYTYTNREKEKVLHFLAFNLLLARDGLYSSNPPPSPPLDTHAEEKSIIKKLQSELSFQTNVKRFYRLSHGDHGSEANGELEMKDIGEQNSSTNRRSSNLSISSITSIQSSKHLSHEKVVNPLSSMP